jgi:hypothetical protein
MRDFTISVDIVAPPSAVWAVLREGERWPEWTSTVTSVTPLDDGPLAVGKRVRIVQPKLPPALYEVTELDEGRGFTWVTRSPGVTVTARHRIEPTASGSKVTLSVRFDGLLGGIAGRMTRKLTEEYLSIEAAGLKARSEGRSTRP